MIGAVRLGWSTKLMHKESYMARFLRSLSSRVAEGFVQCIARLVTCFKKPTASLRLGLL